MSAIDVVRVRVWPMYVELAFALLSLVASVLCGVAWAMDPASWEAGWYLAGSVVTFHRLAHHLHSALHYRGILRRWRRAIWVSRFYQQAFHNDDSAVTMRVTPPDIAAELDVEAMMMHVRAAAMSCMNQGPTR